MTLTNWQARHVAALTHPSVPAEKKIVRVLDTVEAVYADLCGDGYGVPEVIVPMIRGLRNMLNYDIGDLDAGSIDAHLCEMLRDCGWNSCQGCWESEAVADTPGQLA